ncbi:MAG: hypothetical protein AAB074_05645 [Planctomycetota bacterium]
MSENALVSLHETHPSAAQGPDSSSPEVVLSPARELKLDLACGQSCREGFEGVDMFADAKHRVNLMKFPWPWADSSIDELHCSHFVEHIPMVYVSPEGDYRDVPASTGDRDLFFAFFDECWRILKPGGLVTVIVPALRSNWAFQDPTHRRFLPSEAFLYLNREWRVANRLDHYKATSDFVAATGVGGPQVDGNVPIEEGLRSPEVQAARFASLWNTVLDWCVRMRSCK